MPTRIYATALSALLSLPPAACVARSTDEVPRELVSFVPFPGNPVFRASGAGHWDRLLRERGWILHAGDAYHLWFTGTRCQPDCPGQLGYATSSDGLSWQRYRDAPIFDAMPLEDVQVVRDGETYYMFGEGRDDQMQLLRSADRVHWTRVGSVDIRYRDGSRLTLGPYGTPAVIREGGLWYLFYERLDDGIWLATSPDLKVFINVSDQPVLEIGPYSYDEVRVSMNQVFKYQGRYYGFYNGQGRSPIWTTNLAVSTDLINWRKFAGNPIAPHPIGFVVADGPRLRLYTMSPDVNVAFSP